MAHRAATVPFVQLTPRYDGPDLLRWELPLGDPATPLLRQRARLAAVLGALEEDQWAAASRCKGWSVQDVIAHLVGTNQFWALSIASARQGAPTRFLTTFDPVATPELMVDAVRHQSAADTLAQFRETNEAMAEALAELDAEGWLAPAEGPPGHIPLCAMVAHALWDSWIHERDIVVPLGLDPAVEPDEVALSLAYAAALSPAFLAAGGSTRRGSFAVTATEPDVRLIVDVGSTVTVRPLDGALVGPCLAGPAVDLLEGLSFRRPLNRDVSPTDEWMFGGLAEVFDVPAG